MAARPSVPREATDARTDTPTVAADARPGAVPPSPGRRSRYFANTANTQGPLGPRDTRSRRFRLLDGLQRVTQHDRLSHCRRDPHGQAEFVGVVSRDGLASYSGLQTCGSVWSCPVDSAKIRHERTMQLARIVTDHIDAGGGVLFPTATLAHVRQDPLVDTLSHVMNGWRYVAGHREYLQLRERLGIEHAVKTVEVTFGRNGWHPHVHSLLLTERPATQADARDVMATVWKQWNRYAEKNSLRVLLPERAVLVKAVDLSTDRGIANLSEYLFKVQDGYGIAAELVRSDLKRGRSKTSRVPFQIAENAVYGANTSTRLRDLDLWHEYESVTKGRRVMDWTNGSARALRVDQSDDELSAADVVGDLVSDLTPYEWSLVVRFRRRGHLLNVADLHGREGVEAALRSLRRRDTHEAARAVRKGTA